MKLPCELIRDLLPLYYDSVCCNVTRAMVAEHLEECEGCRKLLRAIGEEMQMPKLETDETKPLKTIRRKFRIRTRTMGLLIGLLVSLAAVCSWFSLTQSCSVAIAPEDYTVRNVLRFPNGMYYLEYSHPYPAISFGADIHRTETGELHIVEYRPRLGSDPEHPVVRSSLLDPVHDTIFSDTGIEVPLTAFYLGCPEEGEALLLWSADMKVPLATPEQEQEYLYNHISNW